jgi:uncharacterized protein
MPSPNLEDSSVRIAGNYTFEATREEVWAALNDPEVLARTIPGCQRLEAVGAHEYESTLKVGIQAVRGVYSGRVKLDQIVAPESYEIHVDGKGSNGFLKGAGSIKLRTDGAQTILDYGGEAQIGGTIATVGQRLLDGAARTLINQSLKALAQQIEERRLHVTEHTAEVVAAVAEELAHAAEPVAPPVSDFERRTITVPPGQGLTEASLARGALDDFVRQSPWLPWLIVAFLLGYLFGKRR